MKVGDSVSLQVTAVATEDAKVVAIIKAGTTPASADVLLWYGTKASERAFEAKAQDRFVFQFHDGRYVVMFDTPALQRVLK